MNRGSCCHSHLTESVIRVNGRDIAYFDCSKCGSIWMDMEYTYKLDCEYDSGRKLLVSEFRCPRCRDIFLESVNLAENNRIKMYQCRKCSGIKMEIKGQKLDPDPSSSLTPLEEFIETISGAYRRELNQKKAHKLPAGFKVRNAEGTDLKCPSCNSKLSRYSVYEKNPRQGAEFEICDTCFGIWLDKEDLVDRRGSRGGQKLRVDMGNIMPTKRTCPKCGNITLVSLKYKELETVIDCCPACFGTWLDGGELSDFSAFLGNSGQEVIDILVDNALFRDPVLTGVLKQFSRVLHKLDSRTREQEENLDQAREIQEKLIFGDKEYNAFIPQTFDTYRILSHWIPARVVGGDYFAVIPFTSNGKRRLGICIADVSGKGLPASLLMANLQALLNSFAPTTDSPAGLCRKLNRILHNFTASNKFITFFYGILNLETGGFKYCNGGHNPPVFLSGDRIRWLKTGGSVLSFFPEWNYREEEILLKDGDRVLFYTDGASETENPAREEFGEARLAALLKSYRSVDFTETMQFLIRDIREYNMGYYNDDTTLLLLEKSGRDS